MEEEHAVFKKKAREISVFSSKFNGLDRAVEIVEDVGA
jgi:hypothetical protein